MSNNTQRPFIMEDVHWRDHHSVPAWAACDNGAAAVTASIASGHPVTAVTNTSKVPFLTSKMDDPHIQTILKYVATETGKTVSQLEDQIRIDIDKFASTVMVKAPLLYGTMFENFIEDETIHLFTKTRMGLVETAAKFTPSMFSQLRRKVKMEHSPGMFPLKNKLDRLPLANEEYVLVPSTRPEDKGFKDVKTACATSTGTFAFNYCQKIMEFAHVKGVMPKGKKYKNNGGTFAPEWCYIEFLLLHEWGHYRQADWHYMKLFKETGKICNWVGDFRSNYDLVKGGMPAVPGLLYNRHINYDTQATMREMYDVVRAEFDKLSPPEKDKLNEQMDKNSDDHDKQKPQPKPGETEEEKPDNNQHPGGGKDQDPGDQSKKQPDKGDKKGDKGDEGNHGDKGEGDKGKKDKPKDMGEGQKKDAGDDHPQDGEGKADKNGKPNGKPGKGKPKDGKDPNKDGSGSGEGEKPHGGEPKDGEGGGESKDGKSPKPKEDGPKSEKDGGGSSKATDKPYDKSENRGGPSEQEMEDSARETREALEKGLGKSEERVVDPQAESDEQRRIREEEERLRRAGQSIKHATVDYSKERPTYDWEQLLKQFTKNADGQTEESYSKLNRRDLPQMTDQLEREGTARVKPAEVETEGNLKLTVVVDTSGSMAEVLGKVYANLGVLLSKQGSRDVNDKFNVLRFSDHYELFSGSLRAGKAVEINTEGFTPLVGKPEVTMDWLFSTAESGNTLFTSGVVDTIERLIKAKNSVLIMTDSDCLYGENFDNMAKLIKLNMDKVYVILSSRWEYEYARGLLKVKPNNLSYFK